MSEARSAKHSKARAKTKVKLSNPALPVSKCLVQASAQAKPQPPAQPARAGQIVQINTFLIGGAAFENAPHIRHVALQVEETVQHQSCFVVTCECRSVPAKLVCVLSHIELQRCRSNTDAGAVTVHQRGTRAEVCSMPCFGVCSVFCSHTRLHKYTRFCL